MAVNDTSTKTAPHGAIDQIGHSLKQIIHAFAEASDDEKIFMAKWDVKDADRGRNGISRMSCPGRKGCRFSWLFLRRFKWGG